ncbi:hypothetical protein ABZX77_36830 [Streptomyces sp. NPDC004237]|uniref:hypothetical protein n=1 Tax=Streptomyces sp. NPDC004237 TaxID=3154455 RepID=UPI0033BA0E0D
MASADDAGVACCQAQQRAQGQPAGRGDLLREGHRGGVLAGGAASHARPAPGSTSATWSRNGAAGHRPPEDLVGAMFTAHEAGHTLRVDDHARLGGMTRTKIDIAGLERAYVLAALHNHTNPFGAAGQHAPFALETLAPADAQVVINAAKQRNIRETPTRDTMYVEPDGMLSLDYLWGHSLKLVFDGDGDTVYDIDDGAGLAARAIEHLRATRSPMPATA